MVKELINTALLALMFLLLFGIAELLYYKFKIMADSTRKIVHIGTGLLCLLFPIMLQSHWYVLLLCTSFGLILLLSRKFNLLCSINSIDRISYGSLLYPVAVYISFIVYKCFQDNYLYFYLPLLTMAICDPIAAIFGKKWPYGSYEIKFDKKTIIGSIAFFLSSLITTTTLFYFLLPDNYSIWKTILITITIAASASLTEAISTKGFDNLTIPLSVTLILILYHV